MYTYHFLSPHSALLLTILILLPSFLFSVDADDPERFGLSSNVAAPRSRIQCRYGG
ncbi:hypothetical protein FA13DRAFT_1743690 [Coprinellus micaceus]|uniref:Uncharacterized protein n=1 Tax=Coprinellus micaceus TaxID=71717 RepID=A0A4Y7SDU3_COPMI|nr:hypothetical protein FA13DRAFT_1743690 [Coprinellus micaceus]